ncbi:MAG: nucleotide sugar dehydrogenase [Anaerolineales bacterium]
MVLTGLRQQIEQKTAKLAVIGLGYVGLPVACEFARVGFGVIGVEIVKERVEKINRGISPIEGNEPGLADLIGAVIGQGTMRATWDYEELRDRDVILIDVETPVDENRIPRYEALRSVLHSLGPVLKKGALVIVESTIAPRTMSDVVCPLLEESSELMLNEGFFLGNCPERVMPGKLLANLRSVHRVVGGMTPETAETMVALYRHVVQADLDPTDCITAELVKTSENAYRDVQIAFANEVALICEAVGGDVWKVRELVNKSPGRNMLLPGAGVGGHCIPKDPWLLAHSVKDKNVPLRMIPAARAVNDFMPLHIVGLLEDALHSVGCEISGSRVLVLGYAYLENSDDTRNSPSETLVRRLQELGAEVLIHDPYVPAYQGDWKRLALRADAVIFMVAHREYTTIDLDALKSELRNPVLIDGRGMFRTTKMDLEWLYRGVGQAKKKQQGVGASLDDIVQRVVEVAQPEKIILFGSVARGKMRPDSDIDLLVVKSGVHRRRLAQAIYMSLLGAERAVDVVVVTPEDIERYKDSFSLVIEPALREGKVIYAQ